MRCLAAAGAAALLVSGSLLAGCSETGDPAVAESPSPAESRPPTSSPSAAGSPPSTDASSTTKTPSPSAPATFDPATFDAGAAMADVRTLAGEIGPRLATGPGFREAARLVEQRLRSHGYDVRRQGFPVPAGDSWGVPVDAGRSFNVIATPPGFDPSTPHVILGAHLDTVAAAPGAEDNASGVAVLLELARLARLEGTRLPAAFIAFGAEEPRGDGDAMHHFGSQHYVREMQRSQRDSLRAMLAVDRVGVGSHVPVCTGPISPPRVRNQLLRTAEDIDVPAQPCELTTSDHWSFEKAGFTVARLGSVDYPAYHSERDLPRVVDQRQLGRSGRIAWAWLSR